VEEHVCHIAESASNKKTGNEENVARSAEVEGP